MFGLFKDIIGAVKEANKEIEAEVQIKHANRALIYIKTQVSSMPKHGRENPETRKVIGERIKKILIDILPHMAYLQNLSYYDLEGFLYTQEALYDILREENESN